MAELATRPLLYAHRGARVECPENTLVSFERGLAAGAHAIETDVHVTACGAVVISHDPSAFRMTGVHALFAEVRLDDVRRWDAGWGFTTADGRRPFAGRGVGIPTLDDALAALPGVPLNVDIKPENPAVAAPVVDVIRRRRATDRVRLASFHTGVLRAVRRLGYEGPTALSRDEAAAMSLVPPLLTRPLLATRAMRGIDAAQLPVRVGPFTLGESSVIARCHALGLRVDYWTVNDPAEARALLARGADGIMTDDPAAIAPVFAELARPVSPDPAASESR